MECHTSCGGTAVLQIGFGCEELHTETMYVCETCAELFRDYARSNSLVCGTCDRLCIEFLEKYPDRGITGIVMAGNLDPAVNSNLYPVCLHAVVVADHCTTCGHLVPDPACTHTGMLTPLYATSRNTPIAVTCHDCGGDLDPELAAAICKHQSVTQLSPGEVVRCHQCGMRPYWTKP